MVAPPGPLLVRLRSSSPSPGPSGADAALPVDGVCWVVFVVSGGMDDVQARPRPLSAEAVAEIAATSRYWCEGAARTVAEARWACARARALRSRRSVSGPPSAVRFEHGDEFSSARTISQADAVA